MLNNLSICRKSLDLHGGYEYYFMGTKSKLVSMKVRFFERLANIFSVVISFKDHSASVVLKTN